MKFVKGFALGAATSSYQIEGAAYRDGGGRSTWEMLGQQRGRIANRSSVLRSQQEGNTVILALTACRARLSKYTWPR
jgi:beta-glucosidase/6-phospho-beta-glucosidase/beta-galactosidase